jgi:hypothetical protein
MGSADVRPAFGVAAGHPDRALLARFALLRRPQTAAEAAYSRRALTEHERFPIGGDRLFAGATRFATAADGTRFAITVARTVPGLFATAVDHETCATLRRVRLRATLAGASRRTLRRALRRDAAADKRVRTPPTTISLESPAGRAGGPMELEDVGRDGVWHIARDLFFALVPDGVKSVEVDGRVGRVSDNVVSFAIGDVPDRIVWRDAAGDVVHVIEPEFFHSDFDR